MVHLVGPTYSGEHEVHVSPCQIIASRKENCTPVGNHSGSLQFDWKFSCSGSLNYDPSTAKAMARTICFYACHHRIPSYGQDQMCASGIQTCPTSTSQWPSRVPAGLTQTASPSWSCRSALAMSSQSTPAPWHP